MAQPLTPKRQPFQYKETILKNTLRIKKYYLASRPKTLQARPSSMICTPNGAKSIPSLFTWEFSFREKFYWLYSRSKQIFAVVYN